jgi:hypothetical protein
LAYLLAAVVIGFCFGGLGLGIFLFGRKDISSECGNVPNHKTGECPSKAAGVCPTASKDNEALDMALTFSKFHKLKKRNALADDADASDPPVASEDAT